MKVNPAKKSGHDTQKEGEAQGRKQNILGINKQAV